MKYTATIEQSIVLPASPTKLYSAYLDSREHSRFTGAPARISGKVGGKFTAFGGQLAGRNLLLVPHRMIVLAWRATHWPRTDADSILILRFSEASGGGRIDLVHVNVPGHDHKGVTKGWASYYWVPWKAYLRKFHSGGL
jgi:activator of HSP90 ATPase